MTFPPAPPSVTGRPLVSIIMANYRGGRFLNAALASALAQTVRNIEIIVSDDASPDDSVAVIRTVMAKDARVRLIEAPENGGPARARNRALDAARGEWIAIVDSDDFQHPQRLERMLAAAHAHNSGIVCDDLLHFYDDGSRPISFLLSDSAFTKPFTLTAELFVRANTSRSGLPTLGYLKPLIHAQTLGNLRYDEGLKVAEDYDLVIRLLTRGAQCHVVPDPTYLYRRHGGSISHRLSVAIVQDMIDNHLSFVSAHGPFTGDLKRALETRLSSLQKDLAYERLVSALKSRRLPQAAIELLRSPALLANLYRSWRERAARPQLQTLPMPAAPAAALILSDKALDSDSLIHLHALAMHKGAANVTSHTVPEGFLTEPLVTDIAKYRQLWALTEALGNPEEIAIFCAGQSAVNAAGYLPSANTYMAPDFNNERGLS